MALSKVKNTKNAIILLIITVAFSVAAYFINIQANEGRKTLDWPSVEGTITYSAVGSEYSRDSEGRETKMYFPVIKYIYSVDGVEYKGDRHEISKTTTSFIGGVRETVNSFVVGKKATVYYNPEQANEAILKPGVPFIILLFLYLFGSIVVALWSSIVYTIRKKLREKSDDARSDSTIERT